MFCCKLVEAKDLQFHILNNVISFRPFKLLNTDKTDTQLNIGENATIDDENLFLISKNQRFKLKELFDYDSTIKIDSSYTIDFTNPNPLAISFEYLIESEEDLLAFNEPAFYISVESETKKTIIFAKTIHQSQNQWQKVVLDLRNYEFNNNNLVFYAGNLVDGEKNSIVYIKNLSSQLISYRDGDRLFLGKKEIKEIDDYLIKGQIQINDQIWPIYQFTNIEVQNFKIIKEFDNSLTLLFSPIEENVLRNYQWFVNCGSGKKQLLQHLNYYLLPQFIIEGFWPNLTDKTLINTQNFFCDDLNQLSLELW